MQTRIILFFLSIGLSWASMPSAASAARVICGVDVSLSGRCYRELRRLRRACRTEPVLCGRTFKAGEKPDAAASRRRCRSLRRRSRARWSRGLCGVRLFSPPKTYCGVKGVEVAAACIAAHSGSQAAPAVAPTPAAVKPRKVSSSAAPAAPAAPRAQSPAPRTSPADKPEPAVGMARMTSPAAPASSGTSWWLIFLQLATLLLVFYLLLRRQGQREQKGGWMQSPAWEPFDDEWQPQAGGKNVANVDVRENDQDAVLANLEQIEEKLQSWREHQSEQMQQMQEMHSPRNEMQGEADALFAYYLQLAQHVVTEVEGSESGMSEPRRRLIEARDRLHWIFRAHRELPNPSSPIDELKASSWHHIQRLLETMGYVGWDSRLQSHMANGQFSASEFLLRKSADQAGRFLAGEELQEYASMREEFVNCLERLYRSNLATLRAACDNQNEQLSPTEEMELFHRDYVVGFLLEELPLLLQDVTRRSSPDRSGALVDQFIQFIEDELVEARVELFPILDAEMTETVGAHLIYLLHAGIRATSGGRAIVLREPNESIVSASAAQEEQDVPVEDIAATSASELAAPVSRESKSIRLVANDDGSNDQLTFEVPSHLDVDLSDDLSFDIEMEDGIRASWFDAPAEDRLFAPSTADRESSEEITAMEETAAPSIAHPDSDPPEHTAEMSLASHSPDRAGKSEPLPVGPLPHIENVTQGFVAAIPESELAQRKVTREYGPEANPSISPEDS